MISFFKQFFVYGFSSLLGKIMAVVLMPFYTGVLSKEEYGVMALVIASKGIIDLISNLNIHSGVARDYYEDGVNREKLISTGFWSILSWSLVVLFLIYTTKEFWLNNVLEISAFESVFLIMILSIPSGSLLSYFMILTRLKKKPLNYAIGSILQLVIQICLSVYLLLFMKTGVIGVFIGLLTAEIFGVIYFSYFNREYIKFKFDKDLLNQILKFSIPTLPAVLAIWIDGAFGQILIGKYISLEDLGVFSIALQFTSIFSLIGLALNNVWYPYIYENYKKDSFKLEVNKLYKLLILTLIFISLNVSILSKDLVLLLTNPGYLNAYKYIILLIFPACIYVLLPFVSISVNIKRETKYLSYSYISGSLMNLLLLLIFLPSHGIIIIPIALTISRLINYSILTFHMNKNMRIHYPNSMLFILLVTIVFSYYFTQITFLYDYRLAFISLFNFVFIFLTNKKYNWLNFIYNKILGKKTISENQ